MELTEGPSAVTKRTVTRQNRFDSEGESEEGESSLVPSSSSSSTGQVSADQHDTDQSGFRTMRGSEKGLLVRNRCLVFLVCVFIVFMQAGLFAGHRSRELDLLGHSESGNKWLSFLGRSTSQPQQTVLTEHPIPKLMADAEAHFRKILSRQSRTLNAAVNEYKKRYDRDPPKGFDQWWKFAMDNDVKMLDEYDGLVEDLAPFWEIPGEEIRRRANQVCIFFNVYDVFLTMAKAGYLPSIDLVKVEAGNATAVNINQGFPIPEVSARANGFRLMMEKFVHTVPYSCYILRNNFLTAGT